nr:hypothetical protein [Tanacetum cinerariifolium]
IKTVNDDVRLQAIIDGKKFVVNEASIGAKTTSWNEFSSTMASVIICLANTQKFNFSKYILTSLVKNLEAGVPFYMFPMFIQVFVITNLVIYHTIKRKHKPRRKQRMETKISPTETNTEEHVPTPFNDPLPSDEDRMQLKELMELCTNLSNKVLDLENEVIEMKSSHKAKIEELESWVEKLKEENRRDHPNKGGKLLILMLMSKVNPENVYNLDMAHEETVLSIQDIDVQSERIKDVVKYAEDVVATAENVEGINAATIPQISKDDVTLAQTLTEIKAAKPKAKKGYNARAKKDQIALDKEVARRLKAEWNADMKDNIDWNKVVKQVQSRQSDTKVEKDQPAKKQKGNELEHDNAKKQKLKEQEEAEELKKNLEIVPDNEDDVFVNVTPLSSKSPTIMDYKIYKEGKKERFQIFRANDNHQMYLAFSTLLKNFDREDIEVLWKIVKDRFKKSQLKEVLDVFLRHTLKVMFEHTVEDNVWKHHIGPQGLARVKNWKLFDSCGVYSVTLETIQLFLFD